MLHSFSVSPYSYCCCFSLSLSASFLCDSFYLIWSLLSPPTFLPLFLSQSFPLFISSLSLPFFQCITPPHPSLFLSSLFLSLSLTLFFCSFPPRLYPSLSISVFALYHLSLPQVWPEGVAEVKVDITAYSQITKLHYINLVWCIQLCFSLVCQDMSEPDMHIE